MEVCSPVQGHIVATDHDESPDLPEKSHRASWE